jgi:hypothetical protein
MAINMAKEYNKYSFLFECNQKKLFYSGDCQHINDIQEDIGKVDYVAGWARDLPVSEAISKMHPDNYIIFHYDFPNPDDCKCNLDCRAEKERLGAIYKQVRFIIPEDSDRTIVFD